MIPSGATRQGDGTPQGGTTDASARWWRRQTTASGASVSIPSTSGTLSRPRTGPESCAVALSGCAGNAATKGPNPCNAKLAELGVDPRAPYTADPVLRDSTDLSYEAAVHRLGFFNFAWRCMTHVHGYTHGHWERLPPEWRAAYIEGAGHMLSGRWGP